MTFSFHPYAIAEFNSAAEYYQEREDSQGLRFTEEVYSTIARILEYPESGSPLSENTRRALLSRFPVGLIYQLKEKHIYIIAIADLRRKPEYWKERILKDYGE